MHVSILSLLVVYPFEESGDPGRPRGMIDKCLSLKLHGFGNGMPIIVLFQSSSLSHPNHQVLSLKTTLRNRKCFPGLYL